MQKLVAGVVVLALMCGSATAFAQPLTFEDIPKHIEGSWAFIPSGCAAPALIVAPAEPRGFRFSFQTPIKRDEILVGRPPPPAAVVAGRTLDPMQVTFTPNPKLGTPSESKADPDIDVAMPGLNVMTVKFRNNGLQLRCTRCAAAGIG